MEKTYTEQEVVDASRIAYRNALTRCYYDNNLAFYMFIQGMAFQKTGKMPKDLIFDKTEDAEESKTN